VQAGRASRTLRSIMQRDTEGAQVMPLSNSPTPRESARRVPLARRRAELAAADPRWAAVVARDAAADGRFYYSVRTTGVYCRPSCSARPARPENVSFHDSAADAERAGFRPCRRCRPDLPALAERQSALVARVCRHIEAADAEPGLQALADAAGLSPSHLHRIFKAATGLTPKAYGAAHRARRVREQLVRSGTVTDAIYGAGFGSNGRFYEKSGQMLGMTPRQYRAGGADADIRFAVGQCSLGAILVAASDQGVCAIFFGDDPDQLARNLQDRFPKANLLGGDASFETIVARVVGAIDDPGRGLDLPLDVRGTAFQQRVWQALRRIPSGRTISYGELARRIGAPTATRAVAQACGANPLAVVIPCHRVVRNDGSISGYRWGVERKRILLEREARP
jgi:AraC family transcriptional regulator of adaptative response/methylated-DNA-[protein]-cysteine methyltransferase